MTNTITKYSAAVALTFGLGAFLLNPLVAHAEAVSPETGFGEGFSISFTDPTAVAEPEVKPVVKTPAPVVKSKPVSKTKATVKKSAVAKKGTATVKATSKLPVAKKALTTKELASAKK